MISNIINPVLDTLSGNLSGLPTQKPFLATLSRGPFPFWHITMGKVTVRRPFPGEPFWRLLLANLSGDPVRAPDSNRVLDGH